MLVYRKVPAYVRLISIQGPETEEQGHPGYYNQCGKGKKQYLQRVGSLDVGFSGNLLNFLEYASFQIPVEVVLIPKVRIG